MLDRQPLPAGRSAGAQAANFGKERPEAAPGCEPGQAPTCAFMSLDVSGLFLPPPPLTSNSAAFFSASDEIGVRYKHRS